MEKVQQIINDIEDAGFNAAIAIATEAEIQAGAACGQMCLINEEIN